MHRTQTATDDGVPAAEGDSIRIEPWDEHNQALLRNVHPADWTNPTAKAKYQLVVIGAGSGGLVTAAIAAGLGARVALVERYLMGGDCLNVGCVPSKAMIRAARAWSEARQAHARFGGPAVSGEGDFAAVMERMRRIRTALSPADSAERFRDLGVDVFLGEARFTGPDAVEVDGQRLRFRRAVIATGSRPAVPPIEGLLEAGFCTTETIFGLTERPRHLLLIGGGPSGCELAQTFARLGSRVTLIESAERILVKEARDAARLIEAALRRDGVEIVAGAEVDAVHAVAGGRKVHYSRDGKDGTVVGDVLLLAVGRVPDLESLELQAAGVSHDRQGIEVNDRLRTSNRRIYAVGDICAKQQFTHVADAHARLVVRNALFFGRGRVSELVIPRVNYTSPELAQVGITSAEARERGEEVETITVPLDEVDRARLDSEEEGFLRLYLARGSDRILGATLVAENAGELISQLTQAMTAGIGLERVGNTIFPYPTQAEVIRKAADRLRRQKLTPLAKRLFRSYFRLMR